jgi:hypothetical protein
MTPYKPRPPGSLKAAASALITANGGARAVAGLLGTSESVVTRWGDPSDENLGRHMPVHRAVELEARCGEPHVTRFIAAEAGFLLLALPPAAAVPGCAGDWNTGIARTLEGSATLAGVLAADVADNGIIDTPGLAIDRLDDLLALLGQVRQDLVAIRDAES